MVGVGESIHGIREFLGLRQRVAQFLVERMGYTAVALETGLPDAKAVYDYVLGAELAPRLWDDGFTWGMAGFGGTRELVEWMRAYNRDPAHTRKIHFYGMDISGASGSWVPALRQILSYLDRVEPAYASGTRERLVPILEKFARTDFTASNDAYSALPLEDRNAIAALVNELADRFDVLRLSYVAASSRDDYDWARQIAFNLRRANTMVTNYEARNRPNAVWNARDLAMSANVRWIAEREGAAGGVVVLAHNAHVQTAASVAVPPNQVSLGIYLRDALGTGYRNIGFTFNRGAMFGRPGEEISLDTARAASIDGVLARVGRPMFLLDLRRVPTASAAARWLDAPRDQRIQNLYTGYNQLRSWDALIFVDSISPSRLPSATGGTR